MNTDASLVRKGRRKVIENSDSKLGWGRVTYPRYLEMSENLIGGDEDIEMGAKAKEGNHLGPVTEDIQLPLSPHHRFDGEDGLPNPTAPPTRRGCSSLSARKLRIRYSGRCKGAACRD